MRWLEKQARLEERVHDCIDEIAEEFDLEVPYYPEVFYVGRAAKFIDFGLHKTYHENFEEIKEGTFEAVHLERPGVILTNGNEVGLGEEAMHFIHYTLSKPTYGGKDENELGSRVIIKEMLGYFGSLFLGENREHPYGQIPDPYIESEKFKEYCKLHTEWVKDNPEDFLIHLTHKLGYELGEKLYFAYSLGNFSKSRIRKLLTHRFEQKNSAEEMFKKIRKEFGLTLK